MSRVEIIYFPKLCPHGDPLRPVKIFCGAWRYQNNCLLCMEVDERLEDEWINSLRTTKVIKVGSDYD